MRGAVICLALILAATAVACDGGSYAQQGAPAGDATVGASDQELAERAARFGEAEFKAAYAMTVESDDFMFDGIFSWYQQPGMVRGDFSGQAGEQTVDIVVIPGPGYPNEEFLYVCRRATRSCIESRPESEQDAYQNGEFPIVLGALLVGAEEFAEAVVVTKTLERIIAGQEVVCFIGNGVGGASFETGEVCATRDGVALSLTEDAPDRTISLMATVFSEEVSDDDFVLPYPLIEGG